jgi:hypothetical protein
MVLCVLVAGLLVSPKFPVRWQFEHWVAMEILLWNLLGVQLE